MSTEESKHLNERAELFVRSIPYEATSEELSDFFSNFCPVKHAVIVTDAENKSKGFGFVSFTEADDAKKALEEARKTKFLGRYLQVDVAQKRERGKKSADDDSEEKPKKTVEKAHSVEKRRPRLIIRNLPWSCKDPKKIEKIFAKFGNVIEVLIPKKEGGKMAGFAFVTMRKKAHAQKAVEETKALKIDGREVQVSFAVEKNKWLAKQNGGTGEEDDSEEYDESEDDEEEEEEEDGEDEEKPKKKSNKDSSRSKAASNEQTIFVRNIPYDTTKEALQDHFEEFGPVLYALPVFDKKLNQPKGTAFVAFENAEDCKDCIANAPQVSSTSLLLPDDVDPRYVFEGRVLSITGALQRDRAEELATASNARRQELLGKAPKEKDRRNLFLLNEGRIPQDSKLAVHMNAQELEMREKSYDQRKTQLNKNPSLHLSLTRLAIRNLPRAMNEKGLKALARKAVVEFATEVAQKKRQPLSKEESQRSTKQIEELGQAAKSKKGVVRQSKIIMEEKGSGSLGRSRGYGFVEFRDHKTALMGLRWLNAHEVTREEILSGLTEDEVEQKVQSSDDTKRRRLVVEFAIEHAQITKRRKENMIKARLSAKRKAEDEASAPKEREPAVKKENEENNTRHIIGKKRKMRKLGK
ncbi:uncharacterized protein SAPINGB_P005240 [Magnusiomyces paraingens]|uniref:RRM domain-containing protein n=1 Tax=Magnusiomyces paraingens TaxID=2606893 RepID=A0A5E8C686_9ASCO|nr:uncharacterized protein SAPINGB_P005240 [Saprochaete ingens]VVT56736.1 unnamed protein product [Saprochaete ingens]